MPIYRVYTSETSIYEYTVEASGEDEAREKVYSGDYLDSEWIDSNGFTIDDIVKDE